MIFHRMLPVLAVASLGVLVFGAQEVDAQGQGISLPSSTTIGIVILLGLIAIVLIALRFKWIQVSLKPEPGSTPETVPPVAEAETARKVPPMSRGESTLELSDALITGVKRGLESTRDVLAHQKETLLIERDRLREARSGAQEDTQGYFDAMGELRRSRAQVEQVTLELAKVQERFSLAQEENERIRLELESQRTELEQVRARLTAEKADIERLQSELERERAEVEKATSEVTKEWELLHIREEEIDRARRELFDFVAALTRSREELVAELQAAATLWSSASKRVTNS